MCTIQAVINFWIKQRNALATALDNDFGSESCTKVYVVNMI